MTTTKNVILKPRIERQILAGNHWIFSGAILSLPEITPGELLPVYSHDTLLLGWAYFNPRCSLIGHMVSFGAADPYDAMSASIERAIALRTIIFDAETTNAYRLVNSEADALPGLIVDRYADTLVMQVGTAGMETLKPFIVEQLLKRLPWCTAIYEKSTLPSRALEGLQNYEGFIFGGREGEIAIVENGVSYSVDLPTAQKTGFFLDQREMRNLIGKLSKGKKVLNCFSYTGGFSVCAALNGATHVDSVDVSQRAMDMAKKNFALNDIDTTNHRFLCEDVFSFLANDPLDYDIVILDPPAFSKKKRDLSKALKGYEKLNSQALERMPSGSLLLTCSCSRFVTEELFDEVIRKASGKIRRPTAILSRHHQAMDHPLNVQHLEGEYLKSLLLYLS